MIALDCLLNLCPYYLKLPSSLPRFSWPNADLWQNIPCHIILEILINLMILTRKMRYLNAAEHLHSLSSTLKLHTR